MDDQMVYENVEDVGRRHQSICSDDDIYDMPQELDYRDHSCAKDVESQQKIKLKEKSSTEAIELIPKLEGGKDLFLSVYVIY